MTDPADILGTAPIPDDYGVAGTVRISPQLFHEVLVKAQSPAAAENVDDALYRIPLQHGIDPAVALAFFHHESSYGTAGLATQTRSWGNQRRSPSGKGVVQTIPGRGPFAHFGSWADGLWDWCVLINGAVYRGMGRVTVAQIIPVYAPSSDGNRPARYIEAVIRAVTAWERLSRSTGWRPPSERDPWQAWGTAAPLHPTYSIPRRWLAEGNLGAALGPEIARPGGGGAAQWFERGLILWLAEGDRTEVIR